MHYLLAGSQIKLTYLQDRRALAEIDWPAVFDDLTDAGMPVSRWHWCDLDQLTHVVLATDRLTGRHSGALGLTARAMPQQPWLMIDVALVAPNESGGLLRRAMLAHVLARIVSLDGRPVAVAASHTNRPVLNDLSRSLRSVVLHPPAEGNVIAFRAARLAHQIGVGGSGRGPGGGTVLDLRPASETSLLRDLRRLHGVRPGRMKADPPEVPMAKPARSAAATRRPRKATHTGLSG